MIPRSERPPELAAPTVAPRQAVQFLRARANRLRGIAGTAPTAISDRLRRMADEFEARADELEKAETTSGDTGSDRRVAWMAQ